MIFTFLKELNFRPMECVYQILLLWMKLWIVGTLNILIEKWSYWEQILQLDATL